LPSTRCLDLIARKALRANLSDLAAKGAVPRAYMLDIMAHRNMKGRS
jgi:thiamine monophosphate kinase